MPSDYSWIKIGMVMAVPLCSCNEHAEKRSTNYSGPMNTDPPNVIIIITDDQGYGELSVHGNPILKTPHLDKLHAQSVRLTDFHTAPMCTPTRGQLITGTDAARNGALNVSSGRTLLQTGIPTIQEIFAEYGYKTGLFGKWHLGDNYPYRPQDRGFNESLWFPASHIGSVPDYWENDYFNDVYIRNEKLEQFEGFCTDIFISEAMQWMKKCADENQTFLSLIPLNAPHSPFYAHEKDIAEMERIVNHSNINMPPARKKDFIRYLAMIRNIDDNIGYLMDFLDEEKLSDNTILIFMTDNGSTFGPDYYNAGMRGRKTTPYEGGHRVPFFIRWPEGGLINPSDIDGLTQVQDVLPTLLELCMLPHNKTLFDGISLAPVLKGKGKIPEDRILFINYSRMPLFFDYPSPFSNTLLRETGTVVLFKRWRLIDDTELYDLSTDFAQEKNIIDEQAEITTFLRNKRAAWWSTVKETANRVIKVPVGHPQENPVKLTSCEWMDVLVDMQAQVVRGERKNSYWLLDITKDGEYEFRLRRYPPESGLKLSDNMMNGINIPISSSRILIVQGEKIFSERKPVKSDDEYIAFRFFLEKGEIALHTWFDDASNQSLMGSYYADIELLN
jgi:arylsulfatase A-like enzyme